MIVMMIVMMMNKIRIHFTVDCFLFPGNLNPEPAMKK